MSGEPTLVLRYIERPVIPGSRLVVWVPQGNDLLGAKPLAEGDGFTIDVASDGDEAGRWRTMLLSWEADQDGTALELEVEGRYPE